MTRPAAVPSNGERLLASDDAFAWLRSESCGDGALVVGRAEAAVRSGWLVVASPARRGGERCRAMQCPRCGHRLAPGSTARLVEHAASCARMTIVDRGSAEWARMWAALAAEVGGASQPNAGEDWQYMGTSGGRHEFRHRCHATLGRVVVSVPEARR